MRPSLRSSALALLIRFERPQPLQHDRFVIPKSRYDSVDCYIADSPSNRPEYNDNDMPIDPKIRDHLVERGMDKTLATHFAHLFIRDPIVIFEETLCQDDEKSSDHFEVSPQNAPRTPDRAGSLTPRFPLQNIQSTNWQTVRFKPPPPGSPIGWRVEFRSMEVQLTDYENAAFSVFIVLLTRAIMSLGLNFYLPISKACLLSSVLIFWRPLTPLCLTGRREHAPRAPPGRDQHAKVLLPQERL